MAVNKTMYEQHRKENELYYAKKEYKRKQREEAIKKYRDMNLSDIYHIKKGGEK